jgi:uncharacterized membrane protein
MELAIGILLRAGVVLSATLVAIGGILYLVKYGAAHPAIAAYTTFHGEPDDLRSVSGILRAALALRGRGLIQFGLLVLIATPVLRVALSLFSFLLQRDRLYTGISAFVLMLLLGSLFGVV